MQFVTVSLIPDTSEGFQTHISGFNDCTLCPINHQQFSCENLQANVAFHTLEAAEGWCPDCAVFSTDTDDMCNDWQQKEWKETRQERISMFCTKPDTKTQLVDITFLCMKQQISTSPRGTQWGGTFRDVLALLTQCLSLQCWGTKHSLAFHPTHHMHTEALLAVDPCSCHSLARLSHTQYNFNHHGVCPTFAGQAAELP